MSVCYVSDLDESRLVLLFFPPMSSFPSHCFIILPPHLFCHLCSPLRQKPRVKISLEIDPEISEWGAGGLLQGLETHHPSQKSIDHF